MFNNFLSPLNWVVTRFYTKKIVFLKYSIYLGFFFKSYLLFFFKSYLLFFKLVLVMFITADPLIHLFIFVRKSLKLNFVFFLHILMCLFVFAFVVELCLLNQNSFLLTSGDDDHQMVWITIFLRKKNLKKIFQCFRTRE